MHIIMKKLARCFIILFLITLLTACSHVDLDNIGSPSKIFDDIDGDKTVKNKPDNASIKQTPIKDKKYKIGVFLPTQSQSITIKKVSLSLLNAARLAHKETNNKNMDLIIYPIGDSDETIIPAAQRAVKDKIDLIIGPLLSPSVVTTRYYTEPAGIPMLALSNDQTSVNGGFSYLLSYLPEQNVANIVNYAIMQGHRNFGVFSSYTPYGKRVAETFEQQVDSRNGRVTNTVFFTENAPDFNEKTKQIAEVEMRHSETAPTSWTSLMLPDRATLVMKTMPLLSRHQIDFKKTLILGTGIWDDARILEIEELNGAVFAAPNQKTLKIFEDRYQAMFKEKPTTLSSLAYDAVALASGLIRQYPNNPFDVKNITNPNGFVGVGGIFRFRNDGLSERGLSILRIDKKKFKVVIPAPDTFVGS